MYAIYVQVYNVQCFDARACDYDSLHLIRKNAQMLFLNTC